MATMADAAELAPRMRFLDRLEVERNGYTPRSALEDSILMSAGEAWTVRVDGEIMAIFGRAPLDLLGGRYVAWALTSDLVNTKRKTFYRISKAVIDVLKADSGWLVAWVDDRYEQALRWTHRLGFAISPSKDGFNMITMKGG